MGFNFEKLNELSNDRSKEVMRKAGRIIRDRHSRIPDKYKKADNMKENNILNKEIYTEAMIAASKVDFLESKDEIKMYATSLYNAVMWGRNHTVKAKELETPS